MPSQTDERVFFAIWPPPAVARIIVERAGELGVTGRRVALQRLHLTLAFHGCCDAAAIAGLERTAAQLMLPAFDLALDRIGFFQRSGVVWFGPSTLLGPLSELAARLTPSPTSGSAHCRFTPHVSVARKAPPMVIGMMAPIIWPVEGFSLIASGAQGVAGTYRELARWPLAADAVSRRRL